MSNQYIKIEFASLSLIFYRYFFDAELPRKNDEIIELSRSAYGTPVIKRRVYEPYHRWTFTTLISYENKNVLDALWWEFNYRISEKIIDPSPNIILTDCTKTFTERSPRTRAKSGTEIHPDFAAVTSFGSNPPFVTYYSKFYTFFEQEPAYTKQDEMLKVQLSFIEVNQKVPPTLDG